MDRFDLEKLQAEVAERLRGMDLSYSPSEEPPAQADYGPYHEAAAVLSTFDGSSLRPVEGEATEESIEDVLADSTLLRVGGGTLRWTLLPEVRQDVLWQMGTREALLRALYANPSRPDDPTQEMLDAYIQGVAPPLDRQTANQVAGTFQVAQWLGGLLNEVPDQDAIRRRHERLSLLQPFEALAGEHFRGRQEELQKLRDYVGVLPPGSVRERINRIAAAIFKLEEKPPLVIHGPGGVGKSALVARFIFEHATLPDTERFPWAYIDFDRPGMLAEEPLTLLVEAVRQLGIQYPDAREHCDRIRRNWQQYLAQFSRQASPNMVRDWVPFLRDFTILLDNLKVDTDPFLLVLDTFEEVQYRSDVVVAGLAEFLEVFQQRVPRLRTVFAGRAPINDVPDFPTQPMPLENFDPEARRAFLEAHGVPPATAKILADQVGGNPLSLVLALTIWDRGKTDERGIPGLHTHGVLGFRVKENEIQGQLYTRILDHIHDEDVCKLAHPGLVLRRVTPDLIREVLAEPCGVNVRDANDALRLFDEMRREVALVEVEDDGALRHRSDVRRIMLDLLREDKPEKVRQIQEAAVAYYERQDGIVDRAEEIYHRLSLGQPLPEIEKRWIEGVQPHLYGALGELNIRERAWLAPRLELTLKPEERAQANLEAWERDTDQRVRELLRQDRMDGALGTPRERTDRMPGSSLYLLEAQVLELRENWWEARKLIRKGIASADESGNRALAIDLRLRGARVDIRFGDLEAARRKLDEAETLAPRRGDYPVRSLEVGLIRLTLRRTAGHGARAVRALEAQLRDRFEELSDEQVVGQPVLIGWLASELRGEYPDVLRRIVGLGGLETERPTLFRALGRALAAWDEQLSREADEPPGIMGRSIRLRDSGTLIKVWTNFVLETPPNMLGRVITDLLDSFQPVLRQVWDAIADVRWERARKVAAPGSALGALPDSVVWTRPQPLDSPGLESSVQYTRWLGQDEISSLHEALKDAFPSRQALAQTVRFRLNRSLEVISLSDDLDISVSGLVEAAQSGGWTAQLLAAAREARPESARLLSFSEQYGLEPTRVSDQDLERRLREGNSLLDVAAWRARLGRLETQVCRIEFDASVAGAGFLIGPSLLLTTYGVVEPIHRGSVDLRDVALRFDYKRMADGVEISPGIMYRLDSDWLEDHSPYSAMDAGYSSAAPANEPLDFALVRIAGAPGVEPVGGDRAEPDSAPRGWMEVRSDIDGLEPQTMILILYYGQDGSLQLSLDATGIVGLNPGGTRLSYRNVTDRALPGSPCFTSSWEPVAVHLHVSDSGGEGVPLAAVLRRLQVSRSGELSDEGAAGSSFYARSRSDYEGA